MSAVKVIKVLGTSEQSWEDAAEQAVVQACETLEGVHGVDVTNWTAKVENDEIVEYRATTEIAFPVQDGA